MNKIKCLLVDDEPPAIELLEKYVSMIDQLDVVGKSQSAVKAFDLLNKVEADLIFLDIRMPVLNGLDFIKTLKHPPSIIITTAYREYALEGYDLDIIDYLLKPIAFNRFLKAVDRYRSKSIPSEPSVLSPPSKQHIYFNVNRTQHKVDLDSILYIESLKDYSRIHIEGTENLVVKGNLGSILKQLAAERFVRIHRSYAIAKQHIKNYNQAEIKVGDSKLPIGISYRDTIKDKIGK